MIVISQYILQQDGFWPALISKDFPLTLILDLEQNALICIFLKLFRVIEIHQNHYICFYQVLSRPELSDIFIVSVKTGCQIILP